MKCLVSMSSSKHKSILERAVEFAFSPAIREQDSYVGLVQCGNNYYVFLIAKFREKK